MKMCNLDNETATPEHYCLMSVTPQLRWKPKPKTMIKGSLVGATRPVLQQAHQCQTCGEVEWKDVPLV